MDLDQGAHLKRSAQLVAQFWGLGLVPSFVSHLSYACSSNVDAIWQRRYFQPDSPINKILDMGKRSKR